MSKNRKHKSTLKRIEKIRKLTEEHYEPGNQSKCYHAVWRAHIFPSYGICYRTYLNYINAPIDEPPKKSDDGQLDLFR